MKKNNYKKWMIASCTILGIASLSLNNEIYADTENQATTGVNVILNRKILPEELPGSSTSENGSHSMTDNANTLTVAKPTDKQQSILPKTGMISNNWSLWGSLLVGLLLLRQIISGSKKSKKEER